MNPAEDPKANLWGRTASSRTGLAEEEEEEDEEPRQRRLAGSVSRSDRHFLSAGGEPSVSLRLPVRVFYGWRSCRASQQLQLHSQDS